MFSITLSKSSLPCIFIYVSFEKALIENFIESSPLSMTDFAFSGVARAPFVLIYIYS